MLYLDTSLIVSALTNEPTTDRVQEWLRALGANRLLISDWTITEFSSALSVNIRTGRLTTDKRDAALLGFDKFQADSLTVLPVDPLHFQIAHRLPAIIDLSCVLETHCILRSHQSSPHGLYA